MNTRRGFLGRFAALVGIAAAPAVLRADQITVIPRYKDAQDTEALTVTEFKVIGSNYDGHRRVINSKKFSPITLMPGDSLQITWSYEWSTEA